MLLWEWLNWRFLWKSFEKIIYFEALFSENSFELIFFYRLRCYLFIFRCLPHHKRFPDAFVFLPVLNKPSWVKITVNKLKFLGAFISNGLKLPDHLSGILLLLLTPLFRLVFILLIHDKLEDPLSWKGGILNFFFFLWKSSIILNLLKHCEWEAGLIGLQREAGLITFSDRFQAFQQSLKTNFYLLSVIVFTFFSNNLERLDKLFPATPIVTVHQLLQYQIFPTNQRSPHIIKQQIYYIWNFIPIQLRKHPFCFC